MNEGQIHQIYGTHCTYGTSAIERRDGEMGERVLGYGARASSLPPQELRRDFRAFERFIGYYLPSDTPREDKQTITPQEAPRRLLFHPAVSKYQLLTQVCYRQQDATLKSYGSYFAHLLVAQRKEDEAPWSPLDCLKLWDAPHWIAEDSITFDYDLPALDDLHDLRKNGQSSRQDPPIDDRVLRSFLTTPCGDTFYSPHPGMIPPRWRQMEAEQRQQLFVTAFKGFLQNASRRRDPSLLLVVEPNVAVIFFYGIIRLLPPGKLRDEISFSTYEPSPTRITTTLAATTFHEPEIKDVSNDLYSRTFVVNTFRAARASQVDPRAKFVFATGVFDELVANDTKDDECWANIDRVLDTFAATGIKEISGLDRLATADATLRKILDSETIVPDKQWQEDETAYLKEGVAKYLKSESKEDLVRFGKPPGDNKGVEPFDNLKPILRLVATEDCDADLEAKVRPLVDMVPDDRIGEFVKLDAVARRFKKSRLITYVQKKGNLPDGCEDLWKLPAQFGGTQREAHSLFLEILERVDINAWTGLLEAAPDQYRVPLFLNMIWLTTQRDSQRDEETTRERLIFLQAKIEDLDHDDACSVLSAFDSSNDLPKPQREIFGKRLVYILNDLHKDPKTFGSRLGVLNDFQHLMLKFDKKGSSLPDNASSPFISIEWRLQHWTKIRDALRKADAKRKESESQGFISKLRSGGAADRLAQDDLAESLCKSLKEAMPDWMSGVLGSLSNAERAKLLKDICQFMGVDTRVLPYDLDKGVESYFDHGAYHKSVAATEKNKRKSPIRSLITLAAIAGLVAVVYAVLATIWPTDPSVALRPPENPAGATDSDNESPPANPGPAATPDAPPADASPGDAPPADAPPADAPPADAPPADAPPADAPPADAPPADAPPADAPPADAPPADAPPADAPPADAPPADAPPADAPPANSDTEPVVTPMNVQPEQEPEEPKITLFRAKGPLRDFSEYNDEPEGPTRSESEILKNLSGWKVAQVHGLTKIAPNLEVDDSTKLFVKLTGKPEKRLWSFEIDRTGKLMGSVFKYSVTAERETRAIQERLRNCVLELRDAEGQRGFIALKKTMLDSPETEAMEASIQIAPENSIVPPFDAGTELYIEDGKLTLKPNTDFPVFPFGQTIEGTELKKGSFKTEIEIPGLVEAYKEDGLQQAWIRVKKSGAYVTLSLRTVPDIESDRKKVEQKYDRLLEEQKRLKEEHEKFARDLTDATPDVKIADAHPALKKLAEKIGAKCPALPNEPNLLPIPQPPRNRGKKAQQEYGEKVKAVKAANKKLEDALNAEISRYKSDRDMIKSKATEYATTHYAEPRERITTEISALKRQLTDRLLSLVTLKKQFSVNVFRVVEIAPNEFVRVDVIAPSAAGDAVFVSP